MDKIELLILLQEIFRDILENDDIVLTDNSSAEDINEWDSLAHVQLIDAIQKRFGIKFTAKEMLGWDNVAGIVDCIITKLK